MAAYASLTSLMHILDQIQNHPRPPITIDKQQTESLCENISFLQDFLEGFSHGGGCSEGQGHLESQIADAAYTAEDIIESHVVGRILSEEKSSNNLFYQSLQKVIEDMDLIKKGVIEIQEKILGINADQLPRNVVSMSVGSSTPTPTRKNIMVGFEDVLMEVLDRLTGQEANRQILPIVGMGGIGKTTLARNAYNHPIIVQHFHIRIWVTISQEYKLRDILLGALFCVTETENDENLAKFLDEFSQGTSEDEIGHQLYQSLYGRKYLVIMDDMWSIEAWDRAKFFFPDNDNGSRIAITTRLSDVSNHFGSCGFKINFLDEDKSWELFCKTVFPQDQCCPLELEETGMKIAINCKGLPLSIVVIGGLLVKSEKTHEYWDYVAKNLNSIITLEENEHCLSILSLSYNHLPVHLKPCFLYTAVFPEDSEIRASCIKKLWVAEGILKPNKAKRLEVLAGDYLNELTDRNLILVHTWGSRGKIKYCKIHDLLRDLCLREAQKDKFLYVTRVHEFDSLQGIYSQRHVSIQPSTSKKEYHRDRLPLVFPSTSLVRSLICDSYSVLSSFTSNMLRVFKSIDKDNIEMHECEYSLEDIFQLVNSRYIAFNAYWNSSSIFPSSINLVWNLQTLIVKGTWGQQAVAPPEIWEMAQLRHVEFDILFLPDPPIHEGDGRGFILKNLQTLVGIRNFRLSEEVIKRVPNIKKLRVYYEDIPEECWHNYCLNNLCRLNQLESLACIFFTEENTSPRSELLQDLAFPRSLKKLTLQGSHLFWEDMTIIGSLPHLESLVLLKFSFHGPEWNPIEDEFPYLKFLHISLCSDLVYWNADSTHFPRLQCLVLEAMDKLMEIPLDIGEIPTLQSIELSCCSNSSVTSANNIVMEQENLGNVGLHVRAY